MLYVKKILLDGKLFDKLRAAVEPGLARSSCCHHVQTGSAAWQSSVSDHQPHCTTTKVMMLLTMKMPLIMPHSEFCRHLMVWHYKNRPLEPLHDQMMTHHCQKIIKYLLEYSVPHKNKLFKLKILIIKMFFDVKAAKTGCTKSRHGLYMQ